MDRDQAKKERKGYPFFLKAAAFFFALLFLFTAALSALTAALCFAADLYGEPSADAADSIIPARSRTASLLTALFSGL